MDKLHKLVCVSFILFSNIDLSSAKQPTALYEVTNFFLETIFQPNYITELEQEIGSESFSTFDNFVNSFSTYTTEWIVYLFGFLFCAFIGILLLIASIIVAIATGCCQCLGKCGAKTKDRKSKHSKCKQNCCGLVLLISTGCVIFGASCLFMATNELYDEVKIDQNTVNVWDDLQQAFTGINNYFNASIGTIESQVYEPYSNFSDKLISTVFDIPEELDIYLSTLNEQLEVGESLQNISETTGNLTELQTYLIDSQNLVDELIVQSAVIDVALENITAEVLDALVNNCGTVPACVIAITMANTLTVGTNYSLIDVSTCLEAVNVAMNVSLNGQVILSVVEYFGINIQLNRTINPLLLDIEDKSTLVEDIMSDFISRSRYAQSKIDIDDIAKEISDIENNCDECDMAINAGYWIIIGLGIILCIIALLSIFGLFVGQTSPSYKRTNAAGFMLSSVTVILVFYWLFAAFVVALFTSGGPAHTEVCRHLVSPKNAESADVLSLADRMFANELESKANVRFEPFDVYDKCENNVTFYEGLSLGNRYNFSNFVAVQNAVYELYTVNVTFIELSYDSMLVEVEDLQVGLDTLNFTLYESELDKGVVTRNLLSLAFVLDGLADSTNSNITDDVDQTRLRELADQLRTLNSNYVVPAEYNTELLRENLTMAYEYIPTYSMANDVQDLREAQSYINKYGNAEVNAIIQSTASVAYNETMLFTETLMNNIKNEMAPCGSVYESTYLFIQATCTDALQPYNAIWFSLGLCLFCLVFSLIASCILATEYRKTLPYLSDAELYTMSKVNPYPICNSHPHIHSRHNSRQNSHVSGINYGFEGDDKGNVEEIEVDYDNVDKMSERPPAYEDLKKDERLETRDMRRQKSVYDNPMFDKSIKYEIPRVKSISK